MLISKNNEKCTLEKINELEKKYQIMLEREYKDFLLKYNGGETPKTNIVCGNIKTDIRRFYGFTNNNRLSDFSFILENGLGEILIAESKLPIATNSFGDLFVMTVSENDNGIISFIYHDNTQLETKIATSFKEFICMCKSEKIGHIRSIEERKKCLIDAGKGDKITQIKIECWQKEIDRYARMHQEEVIL